ncbi:hypothetical protein ACDW34_09355 [Acinetobacter piscicola]|uniref:hypothetical protein n=1 Tax=Acinetobacter piscicola TaxID=2006115 RepID=UPI0035590851
MNALIYNKNKALSYLATATGTEASVVMFTVILSPTFGMLNLIIKNNTLYKYGELLA